MARDYYFPVNHNQSGYVFNGMIETRKAVEAGCGVVLGIIICNILPLPKSLISFSVYLFVCLILGLFGLMGIQGEPVSRYLFYMFKWRKNRKKPYFYNPNNDAHINTAAEVFWDMPTLKDAVADTMENIRGKFTTSPPEHIEGETFVFDTDPVMQQLHYADMADEDDYDDQDENTPFYEYGKSASSPDKLDLDDLLGDGSADNI